MFSYFSIVNNQFTKLTKKGYTSQCEFSASHNWLQVYKIWILKSVHVMFYPTVMPGLITRQYHTGQTSTKGNTRNHLTTYYRSVLPCRRQQTWSLRSWWTLPLSWACQKLWRHWNTSTAAWRCGRDIRSCVGRQMSQCVGGWWQPVSPDSIVWLQTKCQSWQARLLSGECLQLSLIAPEITPKFFNVLSH